MEPKTISFVCLHGSAKSLIAAKLGEQIAKQRGLPLRFASSGTEPDADLPDYVVAGLQGDGVDVSGYKPQAASAAQLAGSKVVVSFGPDVKAMAPKGAAIKSWKDVPNVSDGYGPAREAIRQRVETLLSSL